MPRSSIDVEHDVVTEGRRREANFLWGIVVAIVLWSIAGAIPGAAFGWFLAETIGPEGMDILIMYIVCMIILGHLVAGMIAGYVLLADRTSQEMPPNRPLSRVTVTGLSERDGRRIEAILRSRNATEVGGGREGQQRGRV